MDNILDVLNIKMEIVDSPSDEEIAAKYQDKMLVYIKNSKGEVVKVNVNEDIFAQCFGEINHLRYNNGLFYTRHGRCDVDMLSRDAYHSLIDLGFNHSLERMTKNVMGAVKLEATVPKLEADPNLIPFKDGDLALDESKYYVGRYSPTAYRLPCTLKIEPKDTPMFRKWLNDLFYPEDIPTIQEYLGYCMVPTTKAQKALFLVGEGGAGKSRIGDILEVLLGDALISVDNTKSFLNDKYKLAELEHCLVLYDDDLDNEALTNTGLYKKLITNDMDIMVERKYGQPFKCHPHAKLIACCNEMLTSAYDNTDGFYRRLLPIVVKPKAKNFVPDLEFGHKLRAEIDGIVQWIMFGLNRLRNNGWVLSESQRTQEYLSGKRSLGNHLTDFMEDVLEYGEDYTIPSVDLMRIYTVWCGRNGVDPYKKRFVQTWISDNTERMGITYTNKINENGTIRRGYKGCRIKKEWNNVSGSILLK